MYDMCIRVAIFGVLSRHSSIYRIFTKRRLKLFIRVFQNFAPLGDKSVKRTGGVCRACGWQDFRDFGKVGMIFDEIVERCFAVAKYALDFRFAHNFFYVGRSYVVYRRILARFYIAFFHAVVQCYIVSDESGDFLLRLHSGEVFVEKTRKHPPKAILRVHIIEAVFHRFDGRNAAENENSRVFARHGGEGVFDVAQHYLTINTLVWCFSSTALTLPSVVAI